MNLFWILFFLGFAYSCNAANILVLCPMPTRSHYNLFDKLAIQLTKKGHHVTIISPYKQEKAVPNLREIILDNLYEEMMSKFRGSDQTSFSVKSSPWQNLFQLPVMGLYTSNRVLEMPVMQNFLKEDRKFDLLIAENFLTEGLYGGVATKYKVPLIVVAPFMANIWANHLVGTPAPASFVPDPFLGYWTKMTFFERVSNTVFTFVQELLYYNSYIPQQDNLMRKHFGSDLPPLKDILKNTSMVLVNHHHSLAYPKPLSPNMIEIGGYHVPPAQPLPQDLKKFMDGSKHGVILFSMGSHLKSKDLPKEMIEKILRAFGRLKYDVLWKFEDDSLKNIPKNVKVMKWLPQTDLLGIKNAAAAIHGMIDDEIKEGMPPERIVLDGFSQGGALALYSALIYPKRLGGVMALSCWLPMYKIPAATVGDIKDVPIIQCHGDCDPIVQYKWGQLTASHLRSLMEHVDFKTYRRLILYHPHPNLKLFITHGGLLSTTEAVWYGVPLIGIPVLGDQLTNMRNAVKLGFGYLLEMENLDENNLYNAVQEVLNNPKYRESMKERSTLLLDQLMKPMDSAIYWIEYVIRHKGAPHMRSAAQDLRWYEYYMLDVLAVFSAVGLAVVLIAYFTTRFFLRMICSMLSSKKKEGKASASKKKN